MPLTTAYRSGQMPALVTDLLNRSARLYPERRAVQIMGGPSLTYAELSQRVERVAAMLARTGVGRGDRVAVMAPAGLAFFDAYLGAARLGAAAVPLSTRLAPAEVSPAAVRRRSPGCDRRPGLRGDGCSGREHRDGPART